MRNVIGNLICDRVISLAWNDGLLRERATTSNIGRRGWTWTDVGNHYVTMHQICFRRGLGKPTHLLRAETLAEIFLWVECPKIPTCVAHVPSGVSDVYCLQCITWLFEQLPFISGVVLVSRPSLLPNLTCLFSSGWICVFAGGPLDCLFSQL